MHQPDEASAGPKRRRWPWWIGLCLLVAGGVLWRASNRVPADATEPLEWRGAVADSSPTTSLRLGSFNIHGAEAPDDAPVDLEATAKVLSERNFDLIGLYEVHGGFQTDQALALGNRLKMSSLFAGTEYRFWHDHFGNALLTRIPVDSVIRIDLPCTQPKRFRNALLATVRLDGVPVHVIATHLDTAVDHDRQLAQVLALFRALKEPVVLMGDLNCTVGDPLLAEVLADPNVKDAVALGGEESSPARRIDHILVRGLAVKAAGKVVNDASDHPLVWAELALPPRDSRSSR